MPGKDVDGQAVRKAGRGFPQLDKRPVAAVAGIAVEGMERAGFFRFEDRNAGMEMQRRAKAAAQFLRGKEGGKPVKKGPFRAAREPEPAGPRVERRERQGDRLGPASLGGMKRAFQQAADQGGLPAIGRSIQKAGPAARAGLLQQFFLPVQLVNEQCGAGKTAVLAADAKAAAEGILDPFQFLVPVKLRLQLSAAFLPLGRGNRG